MRIYRAILMIPVLAACLTGGCGGQKKGRFTEEQMQTIPLANRYELPQASGAMTISLHSQTVTSDEIVQANEELLRPAAAQFTRQQFVREMLPYFRQTIRSKVTDILLYAEARKKAPENVDDALDKAVDQEINRFIAGYGNNYALAEASIRKMGMDWRTFREYERKLIMSHSYLSSKLKEEVRFTHGEMTAYYEQVKDEQFCHNGTLEFHIIDLLPQRLTADQISEGQTAQAAAMELAASLVVRARNGDDFEQLARTWSHGPLAATGGKWLPVTIGSNALPEPYDVLEAAAMKMAAGEISEPIANGDHIFILRLDRKEMGGCQSFAEVQPLVEEQLKFQRQQKQYEDYVSELFKQADMVEMERFADFCANTAYTRWTQTGQS